MDFMFDDADFTTAKPDAMLEPGVTGALSSINAPLEDQGLWPFPNMPWTAPEGLWPFPDAPAVEDAGLWPFPNKDVKDDGAWVGQITDALAEEVAGMAAADKALQVALNSESQSYNRAQKAAADAEKAYQDAADRVARNLKG